MQLSLNNKRILVGITGGIAAYKSAELVRELRRRGAVVRVVMTEAAMSFITPLTMQALSGHRVHHDLLDEQAEAAMGHIELARWADAICIAPASANCLARLAQGRADDLLTTLCLATTAPILVAPAMNQQMFADANTVKNLAVLKQQGVYICGPESGEQACGEVGLGRMSEPADIVAAISDLFESSVLAGVRIVITAGPTFEAIGPVRYLTNHSSGKMGFAIAEAAMEAGAVVTLISGPVAIQPPDRIDCIAVESAQDMHQAVMQCANDCDIFIATAAVADYRPAEVAEHKIKRKSETLSIELIRNPDILADVANLEQPPFTVGFAAETQHLEKHAREKLQRKKINMIAANPVGGPQAGFRSDDNELHLYWEGGSEHLPLANKTVIACQFIDVIAQRYSQGDR